MAYARRGEKSPSRRRSQATEAPEATSNGAIAAHPEDAFELEVTAEGESDEEDHYNRIKNFLRQWGIDVDNAVDMMRCSHSQREDVLSSFKPKRGTRNMNSEFHVFVWNILDAAVVGEGAELEEEPEPAVDEAGEPEDGELGGIEAFVAKWNLNEEAEQSLLGCARELQEDVMASFSPPAGTQNFSNLFAAFVRTRRLPRPCKDWAQGACRFGEQCRYSHGEVVEVERPQQKRPCKDYLRGYCKFGEHCKFLHPDEAVVESRDVQNDGDICDEVARVVMPADLEESLVLFREKWGLSKEAVAFLQGLTDEVLEDVMATFAPPEETQNVSARLITFARKRKLAQEMPLLPEPARARSADPDALERFVEKWRLDDGARDKLYTMPLEQQEQVMASFNPTGELGNVSARFMSFIRGKDKEHQEEVNHEKLERFCEKWGLDAKAAAKLSECPRDLREDVIASFKPQGHNENLSARFMSFVKSRENTTHFERFARKWDLNEDAVASLASLTYGMQDDVMASFEPPADSVDAEGRPSFNGRLIAFVKLRRAQVCRAWSSGECKFAEGCKFSHSDGKETVDPSRAWAKGENKYGEQSRYSHSEGALKPSLPRRDAVARFIEKWEANEDCEVKLRELPAMVQEDVIVSFNPRADTTNTSACLLSFMRTRRAPQVCHSWVKGDCKFGNDCKFLHSETAVPKSDWSERSAKTGSVAAVDADRAPRDTKACKDWASGQCKFGSSCKFSHADGTPSREWTETRMQPCRDWANGACKFGDGCRFNHEATPRERSEVQSRTPCTDYARGNCKFGDTCKYSHVDGAGASKEWSETQAKPARDWATGSARDSSARWSSSTQYEASKPRHEPPTKATYEPARASHYEPAKGHHESSTTPPWKRAKH